jgi:hypothetical protein
MSDNERTQREKEKYYRAFRFVIEVGEDEKENLRRFLEKAYQLSLVCFSSTVRKIMRDGIDPE